MRKPCTICGVEKPIGEFHTRKHRRLPARVPRPECKACSSRHSRNRQYFLKFGITLDEFERMEEQQGGLCAICGEACGTGRRLAVDHDHSTGRVRGLLCFKCNRALGGFDDSPTKLHNAIRYLGEG